MELPARNALAQLRRGVLEFCVLSLLRAEELYPFDLIQRLSAIDGLVTGEGTIYPLLSRLRRAGWVSTTWRESDSGPPRRYYSITQDGGAALAAFTADWRRFTESVDMVLSDAPGAGEPR